MGMVGKWKNPINETMEVEDYKKVRHDEEVREDKEEMLREIIEDKLLDFIEEEVNKNGGLYGMDGETFSDILSYYLENDPKFKYKLEKELKKVRLRP